MIGEDFPKISSCSFIKLFIYLAEKSSLGHPQQNLDIKTHATDCLQCEESGMKGRQRLSMSMPRGV